MSKRPADCKAVIGCITLNNISKMKKIERADVATWLRNVAKEVLNDGPLFSKRYQAHLYEPK